ncbi:MAG TPA: hypothetical protein VKD90_12900 [Gemmataceae bacterium]|nr:hypothetical protein [Gemmataceae bacterium]
MRRALICLVLLSVLGCKTPGHGDGGALSGHGADCLHQTGHKCPLCEKKAKEKEREVSREVEREAVVTQDIMLIPRMVYVPYAPQVPVAPARLGTMVPGARTVDVPREVPETRAAPPPPAPQKEICETLDRCAQMMQVLDKRICDLESRLQNPPPPTVVPPVIIESAPGPRCKPLLPCLRSLCDKP